MTNSFNSTTSTNTDDVLQGVGGVAGTKGTDTGANNVQDSTQIWRVRGQTPGNGWSSQAPIGTQGAEFAASTVGYNSAINVSFDWYSTTQGEGNLQLEYTTDGSHFQNVPLTLSGSDGGLAVLTNSTSSNTVMGSYVSDNVVNNSMGGQDWFTDLTASITDPLAQNDPSFAIEMVNASTGADDISTQGTALNNTSGNWRFDNVTISAAAVPEPASAAILAVSALGLAMRRRRRA